MSRVFRNITASLSLLLCPLFASPHPITCQLSSSAISQSICRTARCQVPLLLLHFSRSSCYISVWCCTFLKSPWSALYWCSLPDYQLLISCLSATSAGFDWPALAVAGNEITLLIVVCIRVQLSITWTWQQDLASLHSYSRPSNFPWKREKKWIWSMKRYNVLCAHYFTPAVLSAIVHEFKWIFTQTYESLSCRESTLVIFMALFDPAMAWFNQVWIKVPYIHPWLVLFQASAAFQCLLLGQNGHLIKAKILSFSSNMIKNKITWLVQWIFDLPGHKTAFCLGGFDIWTQNILDKLRRNLNANQSTPPTPPSFSSVPLWLALCVHPFGLD